MATPYLPPQHCAFSFIPPKMYNFGFSSVFIQYEQFYTHLGHNIKYGSQRDISTLVAGPHCAEGKKTRYVNRDQLKVNYPYKGDGQERGILYR